MKWDPPISGPEFKVRLLDAMKDAGHGKMDLARVVGVSHPTVLRWCKGIVPRPLLLERLADKLGVRWEWLAYGEGSRRANDRQRRQAEISDQIRRAEVEVRRLKATLSAIDAVRVEALEPLRQKRRALEWSIKVAESLKALDPEKYKALGGDEDLEFLKMEWAALDEAERTELVT